MTIKIKELLVDEFLHQSLHAHAGVLSALLEPEVYSLVNKTHLVRAFLEGAGMNLHPLYEDQRNTYATRAYAVKALEDRANVGELVLEKIWKTDLAGIASTLGVMLLEKNVYEGKGVEIPSLGITLTREDLVGNQYDLD